MSYRVQPLWLDDGTNVVREQLHIAAAMCYGPGMTSQGFPAAGFQEAIEGQATPSDYYGNLDAWDNWWNHRSVGDVVDIPGLGAVELAMQDTNGVEATMVFKLTAEITGAVQYFSKDGIMDPDFGLHFIEWDGPLVEVEPVATSVLAWIEK